MGCCTMMTFLSTREVLLVRWVTALSRSTGLSSQGPGLCCGCQPGDFFCAGLVAGTSLLTKLEGGGERREGLLSGHSLWLGSRRLGCLVPSIFIPPRFGLCLERALIPGQSSGQKGPWTSFRPTGQGAGVPSLKRNAQALTAHEPF